MSSATLTATSIAQAQPLTEKRAVLHTAQRAPETKQVVVDGFDVIPEVHEVLNRMAAFSLRVRSGEWLGYTGKRIRNIISIAINGASNWAKRWQSGQSPNLKARTNRSSSMTARPTR